MLIFRRLEYTEGIEVLVGDTEIKLMVHKNVIVKHSRFFRAALQHECKERDEQRVRLPECCAETFDRYLRWIYSGSLETYKLPGLESLNVLHRIVELYILADRIQDIKLCNTITDELRRYPWWEDHIPLPETFDLAYHALPDNSRLRELLVDALVSYDHYPNCSHLCTETSNGKCLRLPCDHPRNTRTMCDVVDWLDRNKNFLPVDLLADLAKSGALKEHREPSLPASKLKLGKCFYHQHDKEVPKCKDA